MDTNEEVVLDTETQEGEGESGNDLVQIPKADWEKTNQTLGSLKRQLKDIQKSHTETKETPTKETKTEEFGLLQKTYLRSAGITAEDEVELAKDLQKKTGLDWDKLVDDDYFQTKLQKFRDSKANAEATSNIKGSGSTNNAKNDPAYWLAKGTPPSTSDIPNRKDRVKIARAFMENSRTSGKKFYND